MARAMSSFPVPVSPWIRTPESVGATISTCRSARCRAPLLPTISSKFNSQRISSSNTLSSLRLSLSFRSSPRTSAFSTAIAIWPDSCVRNSTSSCVYAASSRLPTARMPRTRSRVTSGRMQTLLKPTAVHFRSSFKSILTARSVEKPVHGLPVEETCAASVSPREFTASASSKVSSANSTASTRNRPVSKSSNPRMANSDCMSCRVPVVTAVRR